MKNKVLIVDFNIEFRTILKTFFKPFNFDIEFFESDKISEDRILESKPNLILIKCTEGLKDKIDILKDISVKNENISFIIFCNHPNPDASLDPSRFFIYDIKPDFGQEDVFNTLITAFESNFYCRFFNIPLSASTILSQHKKLFKIFLLSKKLSSEINLDVLLEQIVEITCDVLEAERASVFIVDNKSKELWSRVGSGLQKTEIRFPLDKGIAGECANTGKSLFINDPYNHLKFNKQIDTETGFTTRNILCVPMQNLQGEVIGVFQVLNKKVGMFNNDDEDLLYTFSSNAAKSIENAQLYEERQRQIIELQKSYKELQEAQDRIIRQEKLATIGQIFSGITHEVKNQLTIVSAVASIKKIYPDDKRIATYTNLILDARTRIVNMLDEIRDFSKKTAYEKSKINLSELIDSTIEFCKYDKDVELMKISKEYANNNLYIMANSDKLKQVLINLIRNAAHASVDYSQIIIKTTAENGNIIISVQDFGSGVAPDIQDRLFDPFFTTKKDGTGLGLDICRKIVDDHNGKIWFQSEFKKGSTFFISIPELK